MSLKSLTDNQLIESTKQALQTARKAEVEVLKHFREIEVRKLWIHTDSLYKYLSKTFELTEDQVYPRLQAMRLMNAVPEVEMKLENGELNMTNLLKAQQVFKAESKQRTITVEEKRTVLASLENTSTRKADKVLAETYPKSHRPAEKIKPVAPNQNLIQFYADDDTLEEIENLKARYSHQMPNGKMEDLMKILIRIAKRQSEPKRRVTIKNKSQDNQPNTNKSRSRYVAADVQRELEKTRAEGCSHTDPSGHRCGSHHFLQRDHIIEYSRGGSNEIHNLRWLCGFHNRNRGATESKVQSPDRTGGD